MYAAFRIHSGAYGIRSSAPKPWCTLCLTVQASLWGLFGFYLAGGWLSHVFPLRIQFFVLGFTYAGVLLALNSVMPRFENRQQ